MRLFCADLALASTLDNMRASGAGAGGATALANAALRSKKQISASIQQQEAQNQKLMAQGEMNRQRFQATEEAIINSLLAADTMEGINGNEVFAIPHEKLIETLKNPLAARGTSFGISASVTSQDRILVGAPNSNVAYYFTDVEPEPCPEYL